MSRIAPEPGHQLTVTVVTDEPAFDRLAPEWNALAARATDPNVFLTWDWLRAWWRPFGEGRPDRQLHIVTVRSGDDLVAAAPLFTQRVGVGPLQATLAQPVSYDAGDYGGILAAPDHPAAVEAVLDHLAELLSGRRGRSQNRTVTLSRLASDSALLAQLRDLVAARPGLELTEVDLGDACPYADVRDGYNLARHLKKHKVRQRMRRLSEKYEVTFEHHTGPTLEAGLAALVDLHRRRWDGREDEFQGLLADPTQEAFLLEAVRALDQRGWLRLMSLQADGHAVAVELDFEFGQRMYMFKGAFDPDFGEFSPGQLIHYQVFEDGIARGVEEFDFLRGDHPYKRRWANADRRLVTVTLSRPGRRGRLARQQARLARAAQTRLRHTPSVL